MKHKKAVSRHPSAIHRLLSDEAGNRLSPSHAVKAGKRYRYYVSRRIAREPSGDYDGWRLPARELEEAVIAALAGWLRDPRAVVETLELDTPSPHQIERLGRSADQLATKSAAVDISGRRALLTDCILRIDLAPERLRFSLNRSSLLSRLLGITENGPTDGATSVLDVPMRLKRRGVEAKLVMCGNDGPAPLPNGLLIDTLTQAHRWFGRLTDGSHRSIRELAAREQVHPAEISRVLPLVFLAPDIIEAILAGRHAVDLTSRQLKRLTDLPDDWAAQRRLFS